MSAALSHSPQTGPSQTGPSQTGPSQTGTTQTGLTQTGPAAEQMLGTLLALAGQQPTDPALHRKLAHAYRGIGQELEARAEESAAAALENGAPLVLFNIATAYFTAGYNEDAARWYRIAIAADPDMALAHQNLACILAHQGHTDAAQHHRDLAFRKLCVLTGRAPEERRRVLILAAAGTGNIPLQWILPQRVNSQISWFVEYTRPETAACLPPYDIVLNGVGDPDLDGPTYGISCNFLRTFAVPCLNHPALVSRTRRDRLPALLAGIQRVCTPAILRVRSCEAGAAASLGFPLLARPAASHGGDGLVRIDDADALRARDFAGAGVWYLSRFCDYRSGDGYWRKYRIIYVGGVPYAYHLAISPHWLVHYATAEMLDDPAKRLEEERFLRQPEAILGTAGMAAIWEIGRRLGLDYAGVDFTLLPDGRLLVFEANATMLVHPERHPKLAYKNPFVARIVEAFEALLAARSALAGESAGATQETNPSR